MARLKAVLSKKTSAARQPSAAGNAPPPAHASTAYVSAAEASSAPTVSGVSSVAPPRGKAASAPGADKGPGGGACARCEVLERERDALRQECADLRSSLGQVGCLLGACGRTASCGGDDSPADGEPNSLSFSLPLSPSVFLCPSSCVEKSRDVGPVFRFPSESPAC